MKNALVTLLMLGTAGFATAASAADLGAPVPVPAAPVVVVSGQRTPPVILQLGPTTSYSTINCAEFTKAPDGTWRAIGSEPFGLGFTQGIIPPVRPIKVGSFIYNNIDLYSQLEEQCPATLVRARY